VERMAGMEGVVIRERVVKDIRNGHGRKYGSALFAGEDTPKMVYQETAPATELAKQWSGWGTNLKPAHEPIIVVRKPLHDGKRKLTVVDCVEKYGTGAINIDATRIPTEDDTRRNSKGGENGLIGTSTFKIRERRVEDFPKKEGRFPANCITLDSDEFYSKYFNVTPAELSKKASK